MKKLILLFVLLISNLVNAQLGTQYNVALIPAGFTNPLLNAYGNSGLFNDVANINSMNPAALQSFNHPSVGFSYQFEQKLDDAWIAGIGSERTSMGLPQSIGIVIPINNLRIGLAAHQKYNSRLKFGEIKITTNELPDGTGETYEPDFKTRVFSYAAIASYSVPINSNNSILSFGFRYELNQLNEYNQLLDHKLDETLFGSNFAMGAVFKSGKSNSKYWEVGISYETGLEIDGEGKYEHDGGSIVPTDTLGRPPGLYQYNPLTARINAQFPSMVILDFDYSIIPKFKFLAALSNTFWSQVADNFKDQIEFSGSVVYQLNKKFIPSIGFLFTDRNLKENIFGINENLNAIFLTAGLAANIYGINLNVVIADSHLFSGDWGKQTIFKSSVSYGF